MRKTVSQTLLRAAVLVLCCASAAQAAPGERAACLFNGDTAANWLAFRSDTATGAQPAVLSVRFAALSLQKLEGSWLDAGTRGNDLNVRIAEVPESGMMVLLGSAFLGLAYAVRRRASRK